MEVRSQDRQVDQPTDANAGWRGQNRLTARRISNHESFELSGEGCGERNKETKWEGASGRSTCFRTADGKQARRRAGRQPSNPELDWNRNWQPLANLETVVSRACMPGQGRLPRNLVEARGSRRSHRSHRRTHRNPPLGPLVPLAVSGQGPAGVRPHKLGFCGVAPCSDWEERSLRLRFCRAPPAPPHHAGPSHHHCIARHGKHERPQYRQIGAKN